MFSTLILNTSGQTQNKMGIGRIRLDRNSFQFETWFASCKILFLFRSKATLTENT